jgi:hypothetical protein
MTENQNEGGCPGQVPKPPLSQSARPAATQKRRSSRLRLYALTLIAALLLPPVLTGSAYRAVPDSSCRITGCYNHHGSLRVIDAASGQTCLPSETQLTWSQNWSVHTHAICATLAP